MHCALCCVRQSFGCVLVFSPYLLVLQDMATTVPVKREMLKNIGNVPDWVLKQRKTEKKDAIATKPVRRSASTSKPKATTTPINTHPAPITVTKPPVIPQPITEEVKDPIENGVQCTSGSKGIAGLSICRYSFISPSFGLFSPHLHHTLWPRHPLSSHCSSFPNSEENIFPRVPDQVQV